MTKAKSTKSALLLSALSLLMCVSMLIGSTFAWFTDSVTSGGNKIVAGTLDIQLLMHDGSTYADISDSDKPIFGEGSIAQNVNSETLWEPGKTQVAYLAIKNNGNLALKYKVALDVQNVSKDLYEVMEYDIIPDAKPDSVKSWTDGKAVAEGIQSVSFDVSLAVGATHYFALAIHMDEAAGNNYQGGQVNFDLTVLAAQDTVESDSFDDQYDKEATYDPLMISVTPENVGTVDFSETGKIFRLSGVYGALAINELGADSVIAFDGATVGAFTLADDTVIEGKATVEKIVVSNNSTEPVELTLSDAELTVTGNISVSNTLGKSILNIENSDIDAATIYVGSHMNDKDATAEFNVIGSYVSCTKNVQVTGSVISVWGAAGVDSKIYDSEIHTYNRSYHMSEDANGNALTFQGTNNHINVDIQRSNMHLYGPRSIINARSYSGTPAVNFTIDDSLIWVVTKSDHADDTIPVWGGAEITDTALLFTKNVYNTKENTPAVFKSFVYGNPVIHGNYAITTQCGWVADIALADGQTVTIAKDANVSIYEGAEEVNFVLEGSAKVVVEEGVTLTNIGVKAADGYTLSTTISNGSTVYTVTAN